MQAFAKQHYRPEKATLTVIGDLDVDESNRLVQTCFPVRLMKDPLNPTSAIALTSPRSRINGPPVEPPEPVNRTLTSLPARVKERTLLIAWSLPGAWRESQPAMELAVSMLDEVMPYLVNRNFTVGIDRFGEINSANCSFIPGKLDSIALCKLTIGDEQSPEKVLEQALDTTAALALTGALQGSSDVKSQAHYLVNARARFVGAQLRSWEPLGSLDGRTVRVARSVHFTTEHSYLQKTCDGASKLSVTDIQKFLFTYLNRNRAVATLLTPATDQKPAVSNNSAEYVGRVREPSSSRQLDSANSLTPQAIRRLVLAKNVTDPKHITLDTGLDVVILPHGTVPLTRSVLLFRGGRLVEPRPGLNAFAHEFTELVPSLESLPTQIGGKWNFVHGLDSRQSGIITPAGNLEEQLYLLRKHLQFLRPDLTDRDKYTDLLKSRVEFLQRSPYYWTERVSMTHLLPGHPLSNYLDDKAFEGMKWFSRGDIDAWNAQIYHPANATLYIVGNVNPGMAEALVHRYFDGWRGSQQVQAVPQPPPPPEPPSRQIFILNMPDWTQTRVSLRCQVEPLALKNAEALEVVRDLLDEHVWTKLRTEAAVTYHTEANLQAAAGGTTLLELSTVVENRAAGLATKTFLDTISQLRSTSPAAPWVAVSQARLARRAVLDQQTTGQMLEKLILAERLGLGPEYFSGYAERLSQLAPSELSAQLNRCAGHEVVTLLGPSKEIMRHLDAANIRYSEFDWNREAGERR